MMKLQGLIATMRSLFGDRRPTFGFEVLPFVGVVFFPSSSLVGVMLFLSPAHLLNWTRERIRRGWCAQREYF